MHALLNFEVTFGREKLHNVDPLTWCLHLIDRQRQEFISPGTRRWIEHDVFIMKQGKKTFSQTSRLLLFTLSLSFSPHVAHIPFTYKSFQKRQVIRYTLSLEPSAVIHLPQLSFLFTRLYSEEVFLPFSIFARRQANFEQVGMMMFWLP